MGLTTDPNEACLKDIKPDGQQCCYLVLSEEERAKGFVRPVRTKYLHLRCGTVTTIGLALSETYASDPKFYGGTFCCACGSHWPLQDLRTPELEATDGWAFEWEPDGDPVGSNEEEAEKYLAEKRRRKAVK
jgi:hypothetical protein